MHSLIVIERNRNKLGKEMMQPNDFHFSNHLLFHIKTEKQRLNSPGKE